MKKEFVTYEIALKLKELGFDELCMAAYMKDWSGDTYILELNPLKLDDRVNNYPLKDFYDRIDSFDISDTILLYNFNEQFEDVDGEGNPYDEVYSAPLWQQVIDWVFEKLSFYYPSISLKIYSDYSGRWKDRELEDVDFDNLEDCCLKAIELIQTK